MSFGLAALQSGLVAPETLPILLVLAGLGLSVAEAFAPGAHFVVLGVALLAAGLVGLLLPAFAGPVVLGVLVFLFGGLALYGYREFDLYGGTEAGRTSDSESLKGKTGHVTERVTTSAGEIKLENGGFNPYYAARAIDGEIEVGTEVMVVDPGGGNVVTVASVEGDDEIDRELARERARAAAESPDGTAAGGDERQGEAASGGSDTVGDGGRDDDRDTETERA